MISADTIKEILAFGIQAPSGENAQPWRFEVRGETVSIFNDPNADRSLYNYQQGGSYVAHGALLENIDIAARHFGYAADIRIFPRANDSELTALVQFKEGSPEHNGLFSAIAKRVTNRKPYDGKPLTAAERSAILAQDGASAKILITEERATIDRLAAAASASERMLVDNHAIHDFFFSHVRWSAEENAAQPNGFYVKTLELKPADLKGFMVVRRWGTARILRRLGVGKKVAAENEKTYRTASAMIAIVVPSRAPADLIAAGRAAERVWLTATDLGLSVQPSTGALFLAEGAADGNKKAFSKSQRTLLARSKATIYDSFSGEMNGGHIAMLLRIGRAEPPSAHAERFPLEYFLKKDVWATAPDRRMTIDDILRDLEQLRSDASFPNTYALDENIRFFEAIKKYPRYLRWIIHRAPSIDPTTLLELTDMPFPRWEREMHAKLVELERKDFPGLVTPLVNRLVELITKKKEGMFIGLHLGSGGREVDRQVVKKLIDSDHSGRVILLGVDRSSTAHELSRENLRELGDRVAFYEVTHADKKAIDDVIKSEKAQYIVVSAKNDIFTLVNDFPKAYFDVAYHTLFKHHLNEGQKQRLDGVIASIARTLLEYDGYKSWPFLIGPHTWSSWHNPALMNGSVLSNLRYGSKKDIAASKQDGDLLTFSRIATYLREWDINGI